MVPAQSVKIYRYSDPKHLSVKLFFTYSKKSARIFYVRLFFTYSEITAQNKIYVCNRFGRNGKSGRVRVDNQSKAPMISGLFYPLVVLRVGLVRHFGRLFLEVFSLASGPSRSSGDRTLLFFEQKLSVGVLVKKDAMRKFLNRHPQECEVYPRCQVYRITGLPVLWIGVKKEDISSVGPVAK